METASLKPPTPEEARLHKKEILGLAGLFIIFRLMMLFWFQPYYSEFSTYFYPFMELSDARVLAEYSRPANQLADAAGKAASEPTRPQLLPALPFIDYWMEYPPVFVWIACSIYHVNALIFGPHAGGPAVFSLSVSVFLAFIDVLNVLLIYAIAKRINGHAFGLRAGVAYAMLFFPMVVMAGYFDTFVLFTILLSLWGMVAGYPAIAGFGVGLGFMTKFIPVMLIPAALRYLGRAPLMAAPGAVEMPVEKAVAARATVANVPQPPAPPAAKPPTVWDWNRVVNYFGTMLLTISVVSATFLFVRPDLLVMPFKVAVKRAGWESLRALASGQNDFGSVSPPEAWLAQHPEFYREIRSPYVGIVRNMPMFTGTAKVSMPESARARIASRFTTRLDYLQAPKDYLAVPMLIVLGALYFIAWLFMPEAPKPLHVVALTGITFATGFVYTSGWSPQFVVYMLPLVLLGLSKRTNVFFAVALSMVTFVEMPVWLRFMRLGVSGGPGGAAEAVLWVVVVLRSALLIIIAVMMYFEVQNRAAAEVLPGKSQTLT